MLEKLVHDNAILPPNQHYVRITIPNGTSYETFQPARHPGWDGKPEDICTAVGEAWYEAGETAPLLVPSIQARPQRNIPINRKQPQAEAIQPQQHRVK